MPHKRNHGNNRINRLINQFITNVPELRVPTPEDIEEAIVVLKEVVGNLDFYYGFVDDEWQEVITVDTARELLNEYLNEYLLLGDNTGIPSENAGDRDDCGECIDYNPDDPQAPEENQYTPGDPNKDGNIDILDVILLVHVIITSRWYSYDLVVVMEELYVFYLNNLLTWVMVQRNQSLILKKMTL